MNNGAYMDKISYIVSAGAITSVGWLPTLEEISSIAALLLPIIGIIWLIVQIIYKIKTRNK